jgi:hypothetical protein
MANRETDLVDIYTRNAYLAEHAKQTVTVCSDWMNRTLTTAINLIAEGSAQEAKRRLKLALLDGPPDVKVSPPIVVITDGFETALRVEICSDTPEKVERFRKSLCDLIIAIPETGDHDVMVTIHDATTGIKHG